MVFSKPVHAVRVGGGHPGTNHGLFKEKSTKELLDSREHCFCTVMHIIEGFSKIEMVQNDGE